MHPAIRPLALAAVAAFAISCTGPEPTGDRLVIVSPKTLTLAVGDTSDFVQVSRTTVDSRGRENTEGDYKAFTLISSNPSVIKVLDSRRLVGVAEGDATVTADDDLGVMVSENKLSATVTP